MTMYAYPYDHPPPPPSLPSPSSLSLTSTGNLLLLFLFLTSTTTLWQSNTSNKGITSAILDSTSQTIWQSFDHPTDTLLQTQNFAAGQTLVSNLYSFSILGTTGNLTLQWNNTILYYNQGNYSSLTNTSLHSPVLTLQPSGIVSLLDASLPSPPPPSSPIAATIWRDH